jgi:hypothetical protein
MDGMRLTMFLVVVLTMLLGMAGCLSDHCEVYPLHCIAEDSDSSSDGPGDGDGDGDDDDDGNDDDGDDDCSGDGDGALPDEPVLELRRCLPLLTNTQP